MLIVLARSSLKTRPAVALVHLIRQAREGEANIGACIAFWYHLNAT